MYKSFLSTENQLKQLDLRFPQNSLEVQRLASALKVSPCLVELSLDNAILTRHQDIKLLLQTITGEDRTGDDMVPIVHSGTEWGVLVLRMITE